MKIRLYLVLMAHQGLVYRQGKFSEIEESQIRNAMENYRIVSSSPPGVISTADTGVKRNGLTSDQLSEVVFAKEKAKDKEFWQEISASPQTRWFLFSYMEVQPPRYPSDRLWPYITTSGGCVIPFGGRGNGRVDKTPCSNSKQRPRPVTIH